MILLTHPHALWLLLVIPALLIFQIARHADRGLRAWLIAAARSASIACIIAALAGPMISSAGVKEHTVAVVDISPSVAEESLNRVQSDVRALQNHAELDVIVTGQPPRVLLKTALREDGALTKLRTAATGSDIEAALQLAATRVGARGQIILWTDGLENAGKAAREVAFLTRQGIKLDVRPLPAANPNDVLMKVQSPASAGVGQTVMMAAEIQSRIAGPATIELRKANGAVIESRAIMLKSGTQTLQLRAQDLAAGFNHYMLDLKPQISGRSYSQDITILAPAPLRVWVVESRADHAASRALAALLGPSAVVTSKTPDALDALNQVAGVDAVVIADTPASQLSDAAQNHVKQLLQRGTSVVFTGGPQSFGAGGYANSPLAEILPVRMPQEKEKSDPSTAVALIIDTSGSMEGARIMLAKEVARIAIRRLTPYDKVGIVEFYGSKRWAAPLQSAANISDLNRAINRLTAGGGTLILPAIQEAGFALKNVATRSRHVVVITDGGVESGPFERIIRTMAEDGICVSTILVGPAQHSVFLSNIAQWGRGHFYQVPDRFNVPELMFKQPVSQSVPPFAETPTRMIPLAGDPVCEGIDFDSAPPVQGYVRTIAKPTADVLINTAAEEPIVARWRYGRGYVGVITTQLGTQWSQGFGNWAQAGALTANFLRSVVPHTAGQTLVLRPTITTDEARIEIASMADPSAASDLTLSLLSESGKVIREQHIAPVAAGRWDAMLTHVAPGTYMLKAVSADGMLFGAASLGIRNDEFASFDASPDFFAKLESTKQEQTPRNAIAASIEYRALWPYLVIVSLVSLLLTLLIRRWPNALSGEIASEGTV